MKWPKCIKRLKNTLTKDKAKTLTTINCFGVLVTAGVSFKAGMNVQKKVDDGSLTKTDILKEVAPVVGSVILTEVAGIRSYKTSAKSIADLTMGLNQVKKEYETIEKKLRESVGDEKANEIRKEAKKEIAEDTVNNTPDLTGYLWYMDEFTGACFYTKEACIWKAWNKVCKRINAGEQVTLTDFYYEIERKNQYGTFNSMNKEFGWDGDTIQDCYVQLSTEGTIEMENGTPAKRITYISSKPHTLPERRYGR